MNRFIARHAKHILGVLNGFDRLVFRGHLRGLSYVGGVMALLWKRRVLLKQFGEYASELTEQVKEASLREAGRLGRPIEYLSSGREDKEAKGRAVAERDGIRDGLVTVLTAVETCRSYEVFRDREEKRLRLVPRIRKCLFLYHYSMDPVFGFMNARIQTWFPFDVQICINGREWLARQMDKAGLAYERRDNCFVWLDDVERAQRLMDRQLRIAWPAALDRIARRLNPVHGRIFRGFPVDYYWSVHQSEWASDVMFTDAPSLARVYRPLVLHAMTNLSSGDVMRFLGRKVHGSFAGEIVSDFKDRPEGVRVKHRVAGNSIKLYDKQGSVLRAETTINDPTDFKVYRPKEGDPEEKCEWRSMRKGVADLHRRAEVSQAANERYLDALADIDTATPLLELVASVCRPAIRDGRRFRALRPWSADDAQLLEIVARGDFKLNGFRNRDLRARIYPPTATSPAEARSRSGRISRLIAILRAHGLVYRVQRTHRYLLTRPGQQIIPAILAAHRLTLEQLAAA